MTRSVPLPPARLFDPWIICDHPHGVLVAARYRRVPPSDVVATFSAREQALLEAVPVTRRGQWIAARACAREGLEHVGVVAPEVLSTDRGAPLTDSARAVSLSHKAGLAVALVALVPGLSVGVDVELPNARDGALAAKVLTPAEHARRAGASASPGAFVLRMFSAKEAVYKAVDPVLRRNVEFEEIDVLPEIRDDEGFDRSGVTVRTRTAEPALTVEVGWLHVGPFLVATATARLS